MSAPLVKITKDPITLTITKAKTVSGNFGTQLWCAVVDVAGDEGSLYLPWATMEGAMSAVVQQFIACGVIGPEDFRPEEGVFVDGVKDHTYTFERIFKDAKQYINIKIAGDAPVMAAAKKELGLGPVGQDAAEQAVVEQRNAAPYPSAQMARKPRESANDRIARAFNHVMEVYAPRLAELDPELVRGIVAFTATHAIAYEKE